MAKAGEKQKPATRIEIGLPEGERWDQAKISNMKALIQAASAKRSPEQRLKNELLSIKYMMED